MRWVESYLSRSALAALLAMLAMLARLRDGNKRFLNLIEGFLRNHGQVHAVVHFALVQKNAIVEMAAEQVADGRKW